MSASNHRDGKEFNMPRGAERFNEGIMIVSTKHSEGPWKHRLDDKIWKIDGRDGNVCIIAHESDSKRDKEANARLIAADKANGVK